MDASLDKLDSEADTQYERNREMLSNKNIVKHTPTADTPGATLSLPSSHRLTQEVTYHLPYLSAAAVLSLSMLSLIHQLISLSNVPDLWT